MNNKTLHIVAFDVPYPPDYGGAIDVFCKIKALFENGVEIILHCFEYGRGRPVELKKYCSEVYYYPRNNMFKSLLSLQPYIIASRINSTLLKRLLDVDAPILFEGHHTIGLLNHPALKNRKKLLRQHNVEWRYYQKLADQEKQQWKKYYFKLERFKLKRYENAIKDSLILPLSKTEYNYYNFKYKNVHYLPVFHLNDKVEIALGMGKYILYHGNLRVNENIKAVEFIIDNIEDEPRLPVIIAGKNPDEKLKQLIASKKHIKLIANPSSEALDELIRDAHIHLLPTFQTTGVKLKLLHALFKGRHCLVNPQMLLGSGLGELCIMADQPDEFNLRIRQLLTKPFNKADVQKRKQVLNKLYNNQNSVKILLKLIYN